MLKFDGYPIQIETTIDFFVKPQFLLVKATELFLDLSKKCTRIIIPGD